MTEERTSIGHDYLRQLPVHHYLDWFSSVETEGNYCLFPGELKHFFDDIVSVGGERLLHAYHRLVFCELMVRSIDRLSSANNVAKAISEKQLAWYGQLATSFECEPSKRLNYRDDFFKKDIHLCALRMLTTRGPCHFELSHLSRRFLASGGIKQAIRGLRSLLVDLKGKTKNVYALHLEDRLIYPHFLEGGWHQTYQDIAEQMRLRSDIVGLCADSWFWDPKVKELSPKLGYLRDYPASGGASFFNLGQDEFAIVNATKDRQRKAAYDTGTYQPTTWLMIWPRQSLLQFTRQNSPGPQLA